MRTALVTGGSAGIGAGICRHLLEDGYTVINLSRRPSPVEHERMHDYPVDLSDLEATAQVAAQVTRDHQVTDLLHNAGVIRPALLGSVDLADLEMVSNIHIGAAITLAQAVLPGMRAAGNGRIVLISSRAALGLQTRTCYSATKSGMMGMARTWALELGPEGITVNVVAPGPIAETEMFDDAIREQETGQSRGCRPGGEVFPVPRQQFCHRADPAGMRRGQPGLTFTLTDSPRQHNHDIYQRTDRCTGGTGKTPSQHLHRPRDLRAGNGAYLGKRLDLHRP
jgi:NAD(P)-dependent dehydrogenase (short-subunit alcohol dehydrogenase family)